MENELHLINITSNGDSKDTVISINGKPISRVTHMVLSISVDKPAELELKFRLPFEQDIKFTLNGIFVGEKNFSDFLSELRLENL